MSFQLNRFSISILLLVHIVVLAVVTNTSASSIKYSQSFNDDDDAFVPMAHATHDNGRPQLPNEFDNENSMRSFSIRLRDLQSFIGNLIDDEQLKLENDAIATAGMTNRRALSTNLLFNDQIIERVKKFAERFIFQDAASNAVQSSGKVFLFKGWSCFFIPPQIFISNASRFC